jgi:Xaa-Pro aminopeptidase
MQIESQRVTQLLDAQTKATHLFEEVERRGLIAAGQRDRAVSDNIRDLAHELFGVDRYWHKRIVRSGPHTMQPYRENPPDRVIEADDIVFCDFGPVFDGWEADFGRTVVLGDDPVKHRLYHDLPVLFDAGRRFFHDHADITGAEFFAQILTLIGAAGWSHCGAHAGHLVGEFPHERISGDETEHYITAGNMEPMRRPDRTGRQRHWILEIHLVDQEHGFGGFYEQLLDL